MAIGDWAGRARVNLRNWSAQGECDRCGCWYQLDQLSKQFQWQGASLAWTGYLVCRRCLDVPQEQFKVLILPPDPKPRVNPRPSYDTTGYAIAGFSPPTSPQNQGMTPYLLGVQAGANSSPGATSFGNYPTNKTNVLAQVAAVSGIATPAVINDQSVLLTQGKAVIALAPNTTRTWMLLYNPTQMPCEFALGTTAWNGLLNLSIGPGQAWFWATAQGLTPVYQGIVTAIGLGPSTLQLWCWDSSYSDFGDDNGILYSFSIPYGYQVGGSGIPAGGVYLVPNVFAQPNYAVGVVPGIAPNPSAPPLFFGTTTAAALLAFGGGNLPTSTPPLPYQLWNNGGQICINQPPTLLNNAGVIYVVTIPTGYQVGLTGLLAGSIYLLPNATPSNAYVVGIVPGITPNPFAPPILYGLITPTQILALGGGNLPTSLPVIPGQLWNNGGVLCVS